MLRRMIPKMPKSLLIICLIVLALKKLPKNGLLNMRLDLLILSLV
jgi:hypothetical protein